VTVIAMENPAPLLDYCNRNCGVVLGRAIGALAGKGFRIAHMGHINAPMVLGTLGTVEMGLRALGRPCGTGGTEAAIQWLAGEVTAG
jgi:alanine-glyoxylate transaminase/serine-glyoxylate transaminase/serine-pyruvate transaminase